MKNKSLLVALVALLPTFLKASEVPQSFTYQGRIFNSNGIDPVEDSSVSFKIQLKSSDGSCLLFEETHQRNMALTHGLFALSIGEGITTGRGFVNLKQTLDNSKTIPGIGCSYTPTSGDPRRLSITYTTSTSTITIPVDQTIRSVPYAINSTLLQGLGKNDFLQSRASGDQLKIDTLISKYTVLNSLADGTNTNYALSSNLPFTGGSLDLTGSGLKVPLAPAANNSAVSKNYSDTNFGGRTLDLTNLMAGQTLTWNTTSNSWKATTLSAGTVTSVTAGTGLTGGVITASGTIGLASSGVTPGLYSKVSVDTYGRVTAGGLLTEADFPNFTTPGKISGTSITSGNITTSGDFSTSGNLILRNATTLNKITFSVPATLSQDYNFIFPLTKGTTGQVLTTDGSGNASWLTLPNSPAAGTIVLTDDARLTNSRAPSGTASGDLSGSYPSPVVSKIQTIGVSATPPVTLQGLVFDGTNWAPGFPSLAGIKNAVGISQIPLNCTSAQTMVFSLMQNIFECQTIQVPSSAITGLGTSSGKDVPASGDASSTQLVLGNDSRLTNSRTPSGNASGDLTGTYPAPTLTNTGVSAGVYSKVQVDAKGRVLAGSLLVASDLPAHDWSLITSGKPTTLAGYGITDSVVRNGGSVASFQSGLDGSKGSAGTVGRLYIATDTKTIYFDNGSVWGVVSNATTGLTSITAGSGLTGGTITTSGTIAVDTGVTANKIVALDGSAKLPAVDGSQLTNIAPTLSRVAIFSATGNWTVPAGVTKVYIEAWGAGGGGSGGIRNATGSYGGGAGAYGSWFHVVTPGDLIPVKVGVGGAGSVGVGLNLSVGLGGDGSTSGFDSILVNGGKGGSSAVAGAGGAETSMTGLFAIAGGMGMSGSLLKLGVLEVASIGGYGGSAPQGGPGGAGSNGTVNGFAGTVPGGGGGAGGNDLLVVGSNGGAGGNGRVVIRY
jgi:trimeric autotransporter adhesin